MRGTPGNAVGGAGAAGNITFNAAAGGVTLADTIRTTGDVSVVGHGTINQSATITSGGNVTVQAIGGSSALSCRRASSALALRQDAHRRGGQQHPVQFRRGREHHQCPRC